MLARLFVLSAFLVVEILLCRPTVSIAESLYVTSYDDPGGIYKISSSGGVSQFAGPANYFASSGIAVDASGNVFETDQDGTVLYRFTPSGTRSTVTQIKGQVVGLAFDSAGNLFGAQWETNGVYKFTSNAQPVLFANATRPYALTFDAQGNLYVTNSPSLTAPTASILKVAPDGSESVYATGLIYPEGLAFDANGNLFVTQGNATGEIDKITPDGNLSVFATGLFYPANLAFDSSGNLYEADEYSGKIFKFSPDGTRSTFASGLSHPVGLAFVPEPSAIVLTVFGALTLLVILGARLWTR